MEWKIRIHRGPLASCEAGPDRVRFRLQDGDELSFDHVFLALGVTPRTEIAAALGCELDEKGYIVTDERLATSIPLVYAAGDCNGGQKQVTQAMAEGERAALELLKQLRSRQLEHRSGATRASQSP